MDSTSNRDRDSLHILPLNMIPLESAPLKRTRMIKNSHLESVVEMFDDKDTGSGQVSVDDLHQVFSHVEGSDVGVLQGLAKLHSYDVYSLRIVLRQQGIVVDDGELKLSGDKQQELERFMGDFTRPLLMHVFGGTLTGCSFKEALATFHDPDVKKTRRNLQKMAGSLGVSLDELPKFLEEYGDIFLSTSFYRQTLGEIEPSLGDFEASMQEIKGNHQCKGNYTVMDTCQKFQSTLNRLRSVVNSRFATFNRDSREIWQDMDGERFNQFKSTVQSNHTTLGGVLCALSVKMQAWTQEFPNPDVGGPLKRADFIVTDMKQGMELITGSRPKGTDIRGSG